MDFSWSKEQLEIKRAAIRFAQKELSDGLVERDRTGDFSYENWLKCAQFGIQGLPIPEKYGGSGSDILTTVLVMEGLGYGCRDNGLLFALNAQMWSVQLPILKFGTEEQKQKYLPGLCKGEIIGAHGMTEPDSGSDAFSLRTSAKRVDDGYVLSGTKMFVTNAPMANLAVIFATVDPEKQISGITAFIVEKDAPGFSISRDLDKMGLRSSPMSEIVLQDCWIPEKNRLGHEGAGTSIFNYSMGWERSSILASHVGVMEGQLEDCVRYSRERHQFKQPIGKFQSIANKIAEMKLRLEIARMLLYQVAWLNQVEKPAVLEAALAKLFISESFVQSSLDAISIHGGYGYMTEFEIERDLRDAIGGTIYSGTSDIQRIIIARLLGL